MEPQRAQRNTLCPLWLYFDNTHTKERRKEDEKNFYSVRHRVGFDLGGFYLLHDLWGSGIEAYDLKNGQCGPRKIMVW